jgi:hypothetical protein
LVVNRDLLFLRTLEDLQRRVTSSNGDEYEVMAVATLLRKLLLDSQRLVDQVNRDRQLKIRFRTMLWASRTNPDVPEPELPGAGPPGFFGGSKTVTLDEFLGRSAAWMDPHEISVKDVILYVANVKGSVHAGRPRTPKQQVLVDWSSAIQFFGSDPTVMTLIGIGQTVVAGLAPLYRQVKADIESNPPRPRISVNLVPAPSSSANADRTESGATPALVDTGDATQPPSSPA